MKDPLAKLCGYLLQRASAAALADLNRRLAPLEALGVIRRKRVDGRSQALELTGHGRVLLERARRVVQAHEGALLGRVPEELRPVVLPVLMALWSPEAPPEEGG